MMADSVEYGTNSQADQGDECSDKQTDIKTAYGKNRRKKVSPKSIDVNNLPPVPEGLCAHFIIHKNRYCRFRPHPGDKYCVEHNFIHGVHLQKKRVPCPINPSHSCYESQLEKHKKKCNFREQDLPVYHVKNINSGADEELQDSELHKVSCVSVPLDEVLQLIEKVEKIYKDFDVEPAEEVLFHEALRYEISQDYNGTAARKHLLQQASLVGHLDQVSLLQDESIFVEFGAGKGSLSHWVQLALKDCSNVKYILVEKASIRYKKDSFHKGEDQGPCFERLRMDIEHLNLSDVASITQSHYPVIGIGKHLCGAAADLALRCLMNARKYDEHGKETRGSVAGVMIAQCCHHRCEWQSYVGKQFFRSHGLGPREFYILRTMTSWATCAAERQEKHSEEDTDYQHYRYGSLTPVYRSEIGIKCKHILDFGRITFLRSQGFTAFLRKYIDPSVTIENVVLMGQIKASANS